MTSVALTGREATWRRALTRNGWVLGVWLLLSVLLFWYATLIPRFGQFQPRGDGLGTTVSQPLGFGQQRLDRLG